MLWEAAKEDKDEVTGLRRFLARYPRTNMNFQKDTMISLPLQSHENGALFE